MLPCRGVQHYDYWRGSEYADQGIISVVKHFPGHGTTKKDTHFLLPTIDVPIDKLEKEDMQVFEKAIEHGSDAILVGHLKVKKETGIYPASLSRKFIINNLRKKYRYKGIISEQTRKFIIDFVAHLWHN